MVFGAANRQSPKQPRFLCGGSLLWPVFFQGKLIVLPAFREKLGGRLAGDARLETPQQISPPSVAAHQ